MWTNGMPCVYYVLRGLRFPLNAVVNHLINQFTYTDLITAVVGSHL